MNWHDCRQKVMPQDTELFSKGFIQGTKRKPTIKIQTSYILYIFNHMQKFNWKKHPKSHLYVICHFCMEPFNYISSFWFEFLISLKWKRSVGLYLRKIFCVWQAKFVQWNVCHTLWHKVKQGDKMAIRATGLFCYNIKIQLEREVLRTKTKKVDDMQIFSFQHLSIVFVFTASLPSWIFDMSKMAYCKPFVMIIFSSLLSHRELRHLPQNTIFLGDDTMMDHYYPVQ